MRKIYYARTSMSNGRLAEDYLGRRIVSELIDYG